MNTHKYAPTPTPTQGTHFFFLSKKTQAQFNTKEQRGIAAATPKRQSDQELLQKQTKANNKVPIKKILQGNHQAFQHNHSYHPP